MRSLAVIVCVICAGVGAELAPFVAPCVKGDSVCLKTSAQKALPFVAAGVPQLGLNSLDPMKVERVSASQAGLEMDFRNTTVKGLGKCNIEDLRQNGHKFNLVLRCPSLTLLGDYTLGGKLLILPIEGNGKYRIRIRDIVVKILFEVADREQDGVKYWRISNWKHATDVQKNVEFLFQNLFHGNKQLSDTIHQFANTNWRDIFQEVAPPIVKAIVDNIVEECKKLFDKVPLSQLVADA